MRLRTFPFYISLPAGNAKRTSIATPIMMGPIIVLDAAFNFSTSVNPPRTAFELGYQVGESINELNVPTTQARIYTPLFEMVAGGDPASVWPPELVGIPLGTTSPLTTGQRIPLLIPIDQNQVAISVAHASMRDMSALGAQVLEGYIRCMEDVPRSVIECLHMWAIQ